VIGLQTLTLEQTEPNFNLIEPGGVGRQPEDLHSGRFYRPEWEAEMLDLARVFAYLADCRWFRRIRANGQLDLVGYDYYLGTSLRN
jgi:hypothetical protein